MRFHISPRRLESSGGLPEFSAMYCKFILASFFACAGVALLICSSLIDYSRKLPV